MDCIKNPCGTKPNWLMFPPVKGQPIEESRQDCSTKTQPYKKPAHFTWEEVFSDILNLHCSIFRCSKINLFPDK